MENRMCSERSYYTICMYFVLSGLQYRKSCRQLEIVKWNKLNTELKHCPNRFFFVFLPINWDRSTILIPIPIHIYIVMLFHKVFFSQILLLPRSFFSSLHFSSLSLCRLSLYRGELYIGYPWPSVVHCIVHLMEKQQRMCIGRKQLNLCYEIAINFMTFFIFLLSFGYALCSASRNREDFFFRPLEIFIFSTRI